MLPLRPGHVPAIGRDRHLIESADVEEALVRLLRECGCGEENEQKLAHRGILAVTLTLSEARGKVPLRGILRRPFVAIAPQGMLRGSE